MRIFLIRHGNTFNQGEPVFWCGRRHDLPLTEHGERQAEWVGLELKKLIESAPGNPVRIVSGPLSRHRNTAAVIAQTIDCSTESVLFDERLNELDYGTWEGKTDAELNAAGFAAELQQWRDCGVWPTAAKFSPSRSDVIGGLHQLIGESSLDGDLNLILITSNGVLMHAATLLAPGTVLPNSGRVPTGSVSCVIVRNGFGKCKFWGMHPTSGLTP